LDVTRRHGILDRIAQRQHLALDFLYLRRRRRVLRVRLSRGGGQKWVAPSMTNTPRSAPARAFIGISLQLYKLGSRQRRYSPSAAMRPKNSPKSFASRKLR
jgi:hypothetical protein